MKTIPMPGTKELNEALELVKAIHSKGLLVDFVMIYAHKDELPDEFAGNISNYWFGKDSTLKCLGLVHHMIGIIDRYIRGVDS